MYVRALLDIISTSDILKGLIHKKMNFPHTHVVPNPHDFHRNKAQRPKSTIKVAFHTTNKPCFKMSSFAFHRRKVILVRNKSFILVFGEIIL